MRDFHMKRTYNKGAKPKMTKKLSNFEDNAENFYSDKTVHFYNMRFHATYSAIVTLQFRRALFLISTIFWKKYELL
jgi:hypothetical protein